MVCPLESFLQKLTTAEPVILYHVRATQQHSLERRLPSLPGYGTQITAMIEEVSESKNRVAMLIGFHIGTDGGSRQGGEICGHGIIRRQGLNINDTTSEHLPASAKDLVSDLDHHHHWHLPTPVFHTQDLIIK